MPDWKKVTALAETALTLGPAEIRKLLDREAADPDISSAVSMLLTRMGAPAGFMATSANEAEIDLQTLTPGERIGVWQIAALIGTGGMGEVYRADRADGTYDQTVALKLIQTSDSYRAARFDQERRRLAMMEHPGISRIIDGGVAEDGRPFMAMEYVDGTSIDDYAAREQLNRRERLHLFVDLCDAVSYAHGKLILHRDIKADNVLVDRSGQVRLIDFGIASDLDSDVSGGALTLACAAPEQLMAEPLSVATDVHALGVLLHLLLTGSLPTRQADASMQPDVAAIGDTDLLAIVSEALQPAPADRYISVAALGDDVRGYLSNRPVLARRGGPAYRAGRFLRRYPVASTLAAAFIIALSAGLITSMTFAERAQREAARATEALREAEWQLGRSEAFLKAQEAYSDVLQRSFGGEEDTERLSSLMLERWQQAMELRADDPLRAASLSYAVGRNFFFRGDTRRALEVFDAWMSERFGPTPLVEVGEEVYALMLVTGSRPAEAEPLLRTVIERFDTGFGSSQADLSNYVFRLARITRAPADIERAEALVRELIANDTDPFERLFHHSQLAALLNARGDRDGAYEAFSTTLQIIDENPNLVVFGRDIARYNLASQELGWKRNLPAARALVDRILDEDVAMKGENVQMGRTLTLKAFIEHETGEHDAALAAARQALELNERFGGTGTKVHIGSLAAHVFALSGAGDNAGALRALDEGDTLTADLPPDDDRVRRMALARAYVESRLEPSAADASMVVAGLRNDSLQAYLYQLLVERRIAPVIAH